MALYKRGSIWWLSFTDPSGKQVRQSAGTKNRAEAQKLFDKLKFESWSQQHLKTRPRHTWDEAALLWIEEKQQKKSLVSDISILRFITPILRGKYLDEITRADIVRIGEERMQATSPARANRYLALIRSILNRAMKVWEWIDRVPAITLYKESKKRVRYLDPEEIRAMMTEMPEHLQPVVAFALLTGLRASNILNLTWDQVNFQRNIITFDGDQMKNGQVHTVQLSEMAKHVLISQFGKHKKWVFTYKGEHMTRINRAFTNALKRAGITNYRFHDNRHTWASLLVQSGVSLYELQEMGAWQSEAMVKRYAHLSNGKLRDNANRLADKIGNSVSPFITNLSHPFLQIKNAH